MSYHKTESLPDRLRALAYELESAVRYGLPMPAGADVASGAFIYLDDPATFEAWVDYLEAPVTSNGSFSYAEAGVNGLRVTVSSAAETSVA